MAAFTLGLISDTHIPRRMKRLPLAVLTALEGVDLILHAGDVDDPAALQPLQAIAPVHAVRGNLHLHEFSDGGASLPSVVKLELAGQRIVLTHGHPPGWRGLMIKSSDLLSRIIGLTNSTHFNRRIARQLIGLYPEADIIVFGHSHRAHIEQFGRALLVNPGAVCRTPGEKPTFAKLRLGQGEPQAEIMIIPLLTDR